MLLPSALPCSDLRVSSTRPRFSASRMFVTPPPDNDFPSGNGLLGTCRALQSLLRSPSPSPRRPEFKRLLSPFHARAPPQTRSARVKKATKPASPKPPRGANKRRREDYEEDSDDGCSRDRFSTPKRQRHVPYDLPLGLAPSDFYSLHSPPITQSPPSPAQRRQQELLNTDCEQPIHPDSALPSIEESDLASDNHSEWTASEDQRLVELVLEKFNLSKEDWEDCARQMGKDNASLGRRWQALVGEGNVGLRRAGRSR